VCNTCGSILGNAAVGVGEREPKSLARGLGGNSENQLQMEKPDEGLPKIAAAARPVKFVASIMSASNATEDTQSRRKVSG